MKLEQVGIQKIPTLNANGLVLSDVMLDEVMGMISYLSPDCFKCLVNPLLACHVESALADIEIVQLPEIAVNKIKFVLKETPITIAQIINLGIAA